MKKSLFLIPLALGLFACSNDNLVDNQGPQNPGEAGENSYLSINLSTVTSTGTRDGDDALGHPYDDGIQKEYDANGVIFYFFDQYLNTVNVVNGTQYYYKPSEEVADTDPKDDEDGNVTADINAMIVLTNSGDETSAWYIAAIVNQEKPYTDLENYAQFQAKTEKEGDLYDSNLTNFLMSTSSFVPGAATDTDQKDYQKTGLVYIKDKVRSTPEAAKKDKATIYVERMAAKVSLKNGFGDDASKVGQSTFVKVLKSTENGTSSEQVKYKDGDDEGDVYLKLLGWNVTAVADKSYTTKNLNSAWNDTYLWTNWSKSSNHRSFWALNPSVSFLYGSFNVEGDEGDYDFSPATTLTSFDDNGTSRNYTYLTENAFDPNLAGATYEPINETSPTTTKIIVAGQLVKGNAANAQPLTYSEYAGYSYYGETALQEAMANASNVYYRTKTTDSEGKVIYRHTPLADVNDISGMGLVSAQQLSDAAKEKLKSSKFDKLKNKYYYTYYQFTEESKTNYPKYEGNQGGASDATGVFVVGKATTQQEIESATVLKNIDEFNEYMIEYAGPAKVWKTGYTYYFVDIKHLNTTGNDVENPKTKLAELKENETVDHYTVGYFGVVRNHWYETSLTAVYGFGTPVYAPEDVIFPQTPDDDPWTYIAAEIKILSWHKVQNSEVLGK